MNSPIFAALAPGEEAVAGMIVSPISSNKLISSFVKTASFTSDLQDEKKDSVLTIAPPIRIAIVDKACLLFMV
jgi:hypothetical protein